jgi:hypothetical protein
MAKLSWQPAQGPSPMLIAKLQLLKTNESFQESASVAFWPDKLNRTRVQFLDGTRSRTESSIYEGPHYRNGDKLIRCGVVDHGGNYQWPFVRTYRLEHGQWRLSSSKEIENYECAKFPVFATTGQRLDPRKITVVTRRYPTYLSEPHVGPLLNAQQTWVIRGECILTGSVRFLQTALLELDSLAEMARKGNRPEFDRRVPAHQRNQLWQALSDPNVSATCPTDRQDDQSTQLIIRTPTGDIPLKFRKSPGGYRLID